MKNRSTAVMQRRKEPMDSLDDYPTPPWATRAFVEHIAKPYINKNDVVLEPCSNRGYMAIPLKESFNNVICTDVKDYGYEDLNGVCDFLYPNQLEKIVDLPVDWVFANPPFRIIEDFIKRALSISKKGVFIFARTSLLEGKERYSSLYKDYPPKIFAQYAERVVLTKGKVLNPNEKYWDDENQVHKRPSSATSYAWFCWGDALPESRLQWIPPCRESFERLNDYPQNPQKPKDETMLF